MTGRKEFAAGKAREEEEREAEAAAAEGEKITVIDEEVEELVEPGQLDPDHIHTPGIYVQRIFQGPSYEKRIERRTISKPSTSLGTGA